MTERLPVLRWCLRGAAVAGCRSERGECSEQPDPGGHDTRLPLSLRMIGLAFFLVGALFGLLAARSGDIPGPWRRYYGIILAYGGLVLVDVVMGESSYSAVIAGGQVLLALASVLMMIQVVRAVRANEKQRIRPDSS